MHFSEDDLRAALQRKDPGAHFTQRVMARIHQADTKTETPVRPRSSVLRFLSPVQFRVALACLLVACLAVGGWLGVARYGQIRERRAGELASRQAILALHITTAKLNHVFERVKASPGREIKIRRESL